MLRRFNKRWGRWMTGVCMVSFIGSSIPVTAQIPMPSAPNPAARPGRPGMAPPSLPETPGLQEAGTDKSGQKLVSLSFRDAPLDQILQFYGDLTGRTMIKAPGINATITIKGQTRLTVEEALVALESVLAMNNVVLVPMGEKFFKVVQPSAARQEGMPLSREVPEKGFADTDELISQVITLKYVEIADAQTIIQSLIHGYGKIQPFERINSLLITDTASNLKRIMEILELIDQPTELKVETRIYEIKFAEAAKIASRLNELIADAQDKEEKPRVATAETAAPVPAAPPGVIRARQPTARPTDSLMSAAEAALAEKGIIQGKVKIIADDRTNILIVISRPSNFIFFDKIVAVLDRPVDPEIIVRVVTLEFAEAEQIAGILNEFIGAAKAESATAAAAQTGGGADAQQTAGARALEDFVKQRAAAADRLQAAGVEASKIGQLSPNTKILAYKLTNTLLLMGTKGDIAALEDVIDKLDVMLAQVLIEAVILEVNLSKDVQYGVDWLQRSMTIYNEKYRGTGGGITVREPVASYGGSWSKSATAFKDASLIDRTFQGGGGLSYFLTLNNLNIDAVIQMIANSGDARVLSTPVILTTDNTEASINSSEQRPVVTQTSTTDGGQVRSSYEYRDIGIKLKVKPRINPERYVTLEITQTADTPGEEVKIDDNSVPRIFKRELQASVAVQSRSTIVLGGLVQTDHKNSRAKVPILGDIPLLGAFFRSDSRSHTRTELLVLITPYVLMTPQEALEETKRLHAASNASADKWYRGWSDSPLADFTPEQKKERERIEKDKQRLLNLRDKEEDRLRLEQDDRSSVVSPAGTVRTAVPVIESDEPRAEPVALEPEAVEFEEPAVAEPIALEPEPVAIEEPTVVEPVILEPGEDLYEDLNAPVPMN